MKNNSENIMDLETILVRLDLLNQDSFRFFSQAENLIEKTDDEVGQFNSGVTKLNEDLFEVGQSISNFIKISENSVNLLLQSRGNVLNQLHRIKNNMEGIKEILDPRPEFYN